jgi:hypothetical protein
MKTINLYIYLLVVISGSVVGLSPRFPQERKQQKTAYNSAVCSADQKSSPVFRSENPSEKETD